MKRRQHVRALLVLALLCALLVTAFALPAEAINEDYSRPGTQEKNVISSAQILELALGAPIGEVERDYLDLHADYTISYGTHIPSSFVSININEENGAATVIARPYSYTAQNGVFTEWTPTRVELSGESFAFFAEGEEYIADIGVTEQKNAVIVYSASFEVSRNTLNRLLNTAYNDAIYWCSEIKAKAEEYERLSAQHAEQKQLFEDYLSALAEYEASVVLYKAYVVEKRIYDQRLKEYNAFLAELEIFEENDRKYQEYSNALIEYNAKYLEYEAYLARLESFDEDMKKYEDYLANMEAVKAQLAIIDGTKNESTSLKRSVYKAIIGDTVTSVIANKDAIANNTVGVKPETVDMAGDATELLRTLYADYFSLETEREKYDYYVLNYEKFKEGFINLFISLDKMYLNSKVRLAISEQGIKEKFEILLAQLYYLSLAISDEPVKNYDNDATYTSSYVVNKVTKLTPYAALGNTKYFEDTDAAAPLSGGYPTEVAEPVLVPVDEPQKPDYVAKPTPPEHKDDPGEAPEPVENPTRPIEVGDPGDAPIPFVPGDEITALVAAYNSGEITQRKERASGIMLTRTLSVAKSLEGEEAFKVEFCDANGSVIHTAYADKGTYAEFIGDLPAKSADAAASYEFDCWVDEGGTPCDISSVTSNLKLYPRFKATVKSYKITFNVEGKIRELVLPYGEVPEFVGTPEKADNGIFIYEFVGWDKPVEKVTDNATYTAVFESKYLAPTGGTTGAEVIYDGETYFVSAPAKSLYTFDLSNLLPRAAEGGGISYDSALYDFQISYTDAVTLNSLGVKKIDVSCARTSSGQRMKVTLLDDDGSEITPSSLARSSAATPRITLSVPYSLGDVQHLSLYYLDNDQRTDVRSGVEGGVLTASFIPSYTYYAVLEYSVTVLELGGASITTDKTLYSVGEKVRLDYTLPEGAVLEGLYYVDADGNRVDISGKRFSMPKGGVALGVSYRMQSFSVDFYAEGKLIFTDTVEYGNKPNAPTPPIKAKDENYSYKFLCWDRAIEAVYEDTEYHAKYVKVAIHKEPEPEGPQITEGVKHIIVVIITVLVFCGAVILPVLTIITVKVILRLKMRDKKAKNT